MSDINSVSFIPGFTGYPAEEVYGIGVAGPPAESPPPEEKKPEKGVEEAPEEEQVVIYPEGNDEEQRHQIDNNQQITGHKNIEDYLGQNIDITV